MLNLRKLRNNIILFWHGLLFGLKDADSRLMRQIANKKYDDAEINQKIEVGGVYNDLLNQKETQQVKEFRDSYYRVLKEADKFIISTTFDASADEYRATARRKDSSFQEQHVIVDESDNLPIKLIQFNHITNNGVTETIEMNALDNNETNCQYLFEVDRCGVIPRFRIEKYIKKVVLKKTTDASKYIMDVYCSIYPRQFNSVDALFISEMRRVMDKKLYTNDTVYFDKFSFTTYKAYNVDDIHRFELINNRLKDIIIFDGNFVLKYESDAIVNDVDLTEKYKTKEMDEKYETKALKLKALPFECIEKIIENN